MLPISSLPMAGRMSTPRNGIDIAFRHRHPAVWLVRFEGRVIGDCGIHALVDSNGSLEIGYGLAAPYRGRNFGSEVATVVSSWLLSQPGVSVVRATTSPAKGCWVRGLIVGTGREVGSDCR